MACPVTDVNSTTANAMKSKTNKSYCTSSVVRESQAKY